MKPTTKLSYCTTREAASLLGISLRTVQLWVDSGALEAWRTEGGHRRITRSSVERLHQKHLQTASPRNAARLTRARSPRRMAEHPLHVLIVEHDNALLRLYKLRLESWHLPLKVSTASDGYEALVRVGRESPDLLVTDLLMPGMDGVRMLEALTSSSCRDGMEIVVVTGLDTGAVADSRSIPPGIRVLPKPVPFAELRAVVEHMLSRRAAL